MAISVAGPRGVGRLAGPLRAIVRAALDQTSRRSGDIAIALSDDATLRALNRRWRRIDRATDVLSFSYDAGPERSRAVSGDLAISLERMSDQARRFRVTPGAELARLAIHGALHLAGLDHQRAPERRAMRALEERTLKRLRREITALDQAIRSSGVAARDQGTGRRKS